MGNLNADTSIISARGGGFRNWAHLLVYPIYIPIRKYPGIIVGGVLECGIYKGLRAWLWAQLFTRGGPDSTLSYGSVIWTSA